MSHSDSVTAMTPVTVTDVAAYLQAPTQPIQLVDVREPEEIQLAALPGFQYLPLSQFGTWSEQIQQILRPDQETWVLCHHGVRSAQMCQWLVQQGFSQVRNITGGIDAYSLQADPSIPRY